MKSNKKKTTDNQVPSLQELEAVITGREMEQIASKLGVEDHRDKKLLLSGFVYLMFLSAHLGKRLSFPELACKAMEWKLTVDGQSITGKRINQQLGERGEEFAKTLFKHLLKKVLGFKGQINRKLRKHFRGLLSQDGSVIRLCQRLVNLYTGTHKEAALKIQVRYEGMTGAAELVSVSDGKRSDNSYATPKKYGPGMLWLVDLGYYDFDRFSKMDEAEQYFVSRLKSNVHALIVDNCPGTWSGKHFQELEFERETTYDMIGVLENDLVVRMVGIYNDAEKEYWWYMTNIFEDDFSPEEIQGLYRLRWEIELFFRSLKHTLSGTRILNQEDKSKIRSQLYYLFCYYLLIQLLRLKTARVYRIDWKKLSFIVCERLFRKWVITNQEMDHTGITIKSKCKLLIDQIRLEAYSC